MLYSSSNTSLLKLKSLSDRSIDPKLTSLSFLSRRVFSLQPPPSLSPRQLRLFYPQHRLFFSFLSTDNPVQFLPTLCPTPSCPRQPHSSTSISAPSSSPIPIPKLHPLPFTHIYSLLWHYLSPSLTGTSVVFSRSGLGSQRVSFSNSLLPSRIHHHFHPRRSTSFLSKLPPSISSPPKHLQPLRSSLCASQQSSSSAFLLPPILFYHLTNHPFLPNLTSHWSHSTGFTFEFEPEEREEELRTPDDLERRRKELKGFRRRGGTEWKEMRMKMVWEDLEGGGWEAED